MSAVAARRRVDGVHCSLAGIAAPRRRRHGTPTTYPVWPSRRGVPLNLAARQRGGAARPNPPPRRRACAWPRPAWQAAEWRPRPAEAVVWCNGLQATRGEARRYSRPRHRPLPDRPYSRYSPGRDGPKHLALLSLQHPPHHHGSVEQYVFSILRGAAGPASFVTWARQVVISVVRQILEGGSPPPARGPARGPSRTIHHASPGR